MPNTTIPSVSPTINNIQNSFTIANLDYNSIKTDLITYLNGSSTFTDYDFEASGLSVLIKALAHNTQYLTFLLNMVSNESFLDSAVLRANIVSHAKSLGYTPSSVKSAFAVIDLVFTVSGTPASIFVPKNSIFSTRIDNNTYSFLTKDAITVFPVAGVYSASDVVLLEGKSFVSSFPINSNNVSSKFEIPDIDVDISSISVNVQDSSSSSVFTTFTRASSLLNITSTSNVFFVQENTSGKYEIYFGDGVFGTSLVSNNIMNISYIVSSGEESNGAAIFSLASAISNVLSVNYTLKSKAVGGLQRESTDSIRFQALRSFESQNRAVTSNDYLSIIKNNLSFVEDASIWRGENNVPPVYGKVFISIKPKNNYNLTTFNKELIKKTLEEYNVLTVIPSILDPIYNYISGDITINFDSTKTSLTPDELKSVVLAKVHEFETSEINSFGKNFLFSRFSKFLDSISTSFVNNILNLDFYRTLEIGGKEILFHNRIKPGSVRSDLFNFSLVGFSASTKFVLRDDYLGNLKLFLSGSNLNNQLSNDLNLIVGSVNYADGSIKIDNSNITKNSILNLFAKTHTSDFLIYRNNIINFDYSTLKVFVNSVK